MKRARAVSLDGVSIESLLGSSQAMAGVRDFARKAARVRAPVLILGETGTGKSLLGKIIHMEGRRASSPFVAVNCAGIPDTLFESEFFGHQRGAFTGAREGRKGILEQAQGGTVFLDEVGELSVAQQAKLLMSLEEGEVRRLGGEGVVRVDVRVLSATSRSLPRAMKEGLFRRDLFHRLAVLTCLMPPLRERKQDIPLLARRFLRAHQMRHGFLPGALAPESLDYLRDKPWPGNIRELSHLLEAALILGNGEPPGVSALRAAEVMAQAPEEAAAQVADEPTARDAREGPPRSGRYSFLGDEDQERAEIRKALVAARGNRSRAARNLGMARNTLRQKIRKYGMDQR